MKSIIGWSAGCALLLGGMLLGACGDEDGEDGGGIPIDAQEATLAIDTNVRGSFLNGARAIRFLNDSSVLEGLGFGGTVMVACEVEPDTCEEPALEQRYDFEDDANDIADWAVETLFTEQYVESERGNAVVYLIPASVICGEVFGFVEDPSTEAGAEPTCVDTFTQVPIRLRVTSPREGDVDIELLVGEDRVNPLDVRAYRAELGGEIDLAATKAAIEEILAAAGVEDVQLPTVMRGRLAASLELLGTDHVRLSASVPSDIEVSSTGADASFSFRLGASNPAATLEVDGVVRTLTAAVDLGALDLGFDTNMFGAEECMEVCEPAPNHRLDAHLGGASAAVALTGETDSIAVTDIGLGDDTSWLRLDGQDLARVDLNAAAGRRIDVTVSEVDGDPEVSITPQLALAVALSFANDLDGFFGAPEWAADDTITVDLNGDAAPTVRTLELSDGSRVLQVVRGALSIASSFLGLDATAAAGECAWQEETVEVDPFAEDPHPLVGLLTGACPE